MRTEIPDPDRGRRPSPGHPAAEAPVGDYPPTRYPDSWPTPPLFAGRYEIVRELGRGGMGVVSQARDTRLPRDVAIKVPLRFQDPDSLRRFFKEAEAAAKLDHPNICRILDLGEADGVPFIVLAFVQGWTLAEVVDHRPVGPVRAAKITRNIARTIQFAHDRGIIHRDLKPSNLMIGPHRELIVMDFGLARLEGEERKTLTGQVFGTLPYMSPEQVQGRAGDMGKGCDIYTLGVIFYELLTGRLPFHGPAWDLSRQVIQVEPSPPSSIHDGVDPELDAVVLKAMAKKVEDRFGSMQEFAEAIAAHLRRIGSLSNSGVASRPRPEPVEQEAAPTRERPESLFSVRLRPEPLRDPARWRPTARDALVWGMTALLALIGINLIVAFERGTPRTARPGPSVASGEPSAPPKAGPPVSRSRMPESPVVVQGAEFDHGSLPETAQPRPYPKRPRKMERIDR